MLCCRVELATSIKQPVQLLHRFSHIVWIKQKVAKKCGTRSNMRLGLDRSDGGELSLLEEMPHEFWCSHCAICVFVRLQSAVTSAVLQHHHVQAKLTQSTLFCNTTNRIRQPWQHEWGYHNKTQSQKIGCILGFYMLGICDGLRKVIWFPLIIRDVILEVPSCVGSICL